MDLSQGSVMNQNTHYVSLSLALAQIFSFRALSVPTGAWVIIHINFVI